VSKEARREQRARIKDVGRLGRIRGARPHVFLKKGRERRALLAPAVALVGFAIGSSDGRSKSLASKLKLPWFIIAFFVAVAVNSIIDAPGWVAEYGLIASKAMLLFAVTATAMRSRLDLLLTQGWRALLPVMLATVTAFVTAAAFAWAFL
jgi:uncharacterized membrane protein YadS